MNKELEELAMEIESIIDQASDEVSEEELAEREKNANQIVATIRTASESDARRNAATAKSESPPPNPNPPTPSHRWGSRCSFPSMPDVWRGDTSVHGVCVGARHDSNHVCSFGIASRSPLRKRERDFSD